MKRLGSRGTVIAVASAAGYFPVAAGPVYAAAKAGVVHLVRSLGPRAAKEFGVRSVTSYLLHAFHVLIVFLLAFVLLAWFTWCAL